MRIAINATFRMHGGGMIHLRNLLHAWSEQGVLRQHTVRLFCRPDTPSLLNLAAASPIEVTTVNWQGMAGLKRLLWEQLFLPKLARDCDVLLCPGGIVPFFSSTPSVVVFQNAAPFSDTFTPSVVGLQNWASFWILGRAMRISARASKRVIFLSNYFRHIFVERFSFPQDLGDVIYHGRDGLPASCSASTKSKAFLGRFILSPSHLYRYKNIPVLIQAYGLARSVLQAHGMKLIIAGKPKDPNYGKALQRLICSLDLQTWVQLIGPVPHAQIGELMASSEFVVFQSTVENCPTTLIEALAIGTAISCSSASVMPEICGNAADYFDPFDPRSIANSLIRLCVDNKLREDLKQKAILRSVQFPSWDEVGKLTLLALTGAVSRDRACAA